MSKDLNISVLVAARDEYIEQLKCILCPLITQGFTSIYEDSVKLSNGSKIIYKFQELLKDIPKWNQTILQEEAKRIKKKCTYIMDIVTAIFVSNVKILASIRLSGENENIRIKIPTSDIFVHSIYIESAQKIFYEPFLFYHRITNYSDIQKNKLIVNNIIRDSIDESIRRFLPYEDILQEYLSKALNNEESSDSEKEINELSDSDEESLHGDNFIDDDPIENPEEQVKDLSLSHLSTNHQQNHNVTKLNESGDSDSSDSDSSDSDLNDSDLNNQINNNQINNNQINNNQPPNNYQINNNQPPNNFQINNNQPPNNFQQSLQPQNNFQQPVPPPNNFQQPVPPQNNNQDNNKYSFF